MEFRYYRHSLLILCISGLVACGGSDGETAEPAAPTDTASLTGTEGGGNGGGSGGGSGNGGGEGGGVAFINFPESAQCGVDFASISPQQLDKPASQRQFEIFSPCGPDRFDSFVTNDGAVNNAAMECDGTARANYQAIFPVDNTDCN